MEPEVVPVRSDSSSLSKSSLSKSTLDEDLDYRAKEKRLGKFLARIKTLRRKKKRADEKYPPFELANRERNEETFGNNRLTTYKYTILTFLPKNLFEQFRKATNIYFLIMTIISFIPVISPLPGWTSALPFALVLLAGMIKEGIEDYRRHMADRTINNRPYTVISNQGLPEVRRSEELTVGDFVVLQQNQEVPADCLVVATSDADGVCYVETAQLDGETNLKRRTPFRPTERLTHEQFAELRGSVHCSTPSFHLDEFSGAVELTSGPDTLPREALDGRRLPVDEENLVLRGTVLRNTTWIVALVCYAGFKTKLALNSSAPPSKYSALNKMVDIMVLTIIGVQIVFCIAAAILASQWAYANDATALYLMQTDSPPVVGVISFFAYLILLSYVVPQTLMISLEVAKLVQGLWISWDADLALDPTRPVETGAKARSTDQNDELGRVRWIMSDKTGTLTANDMKMVEAVIGGVPYKDVMHGSVMDALRRSGTDQARVISEYLFCLSVCHSVTIGEVITAEQQEKQKESPWKQLLQRMRSSRKKSKKNYSESPLESSEGGASSAMTASTASTASTATSGGSIEMDRFPTGKWKDLVYKGSSPDEEAFVKFTLRNGFVFSSRVRDMTEVTVEIDPDHPDVYGFQILHVLEYSSRRARMGVICRDRDGNITLYEKGSDAVINQRLNLDKTSKEVLRETTDCIDKLAAKGLRTLVIARRTLEPDFYADWAERLRKASTGEDGTSVDDRAEVQQRLYEEVEADLELLGVTAVEDRLQDLVPECIEFFLAAGIRFVMITGDKLETAENIARSTRLITREMTVVEMSGAKDPMLAESLLLEAETRANESPKLAIVVDGATLKYLLKPSLKMSDRFYHLLKRAAAVVCCRSNPRTKAKVVSLVRDHDARDITLAIGDGGNDVNMIQRAHIGVGLVGREGTQAARSSDYALRQFKHLKKLIAVHGRWNFLRNSTIVQYWVYKNTAFIFVLFWYGIYCAWSGLNYYDSWIITLFNVFFTALPPLFFAFAEQDVSPEVAFRYPQLYQEPQSGRNFTPITFCIWIIEALYVSVICYFFSYAVFQSDILSQGYTYDLSFQGNAVSIYAITIVNLRMLLETRHHTWFIHLSYWISFALLLLVLIVENFALDFTPTQYGVISELFKSSIFWLLYLLTVVVSLLPAIIAKSFFATFAPWDSQVAREIEKIGKEKRAHMVTVRSNSHLVKDTD